MLKTISITQKQYTQTMLKWDFGFSNILKTFEENVEMDYFKMTTL